MSRIGSLPVQIPEKTTVEVNDSNEVTVKGPMGEGTQKVHPDIEVKVEDGQVVFNRPTNQKRHKAMHGLYRSLVNNLVIGVSEGYKIQLELVGVGFRAESKGQILEMALGYSHEIHFELPQEVKVEAKTEKRKNPVITLTSHDKELIGLIASKIRSFRPPEPYKGKGVKFVGEQIRRKAGKAAS